MRYPAQETAAKHDRIVKEASRLFRERGFENVTVGEVMKAAGLTHGAFYAHFASKQELEKAAVAYGQDASARRARSYGATKKGRKAYADRYLSPRHRDNPGDGCTMAALARGGGPLSARTQSSLRARIRGNSLRGRWGAERKPSFRQPLCSAESCWLAPSRIRGSRMRFFRVCDRRSADGGQFVVTGKSAHPSSV